MTNLERLQKMTAKELANEVFNNTDWLCDNVFSYDGIVFRTANELEKWLTSKSERQEGF